MLANPASVITAWLSNYIYVKQLGGGGGGGSSLLIHTQTLVHKTQQRKWETQSGINQHKKVNDEDTPESNSCIAEIWVIHKDCNNFPQMI